ncbi:molybdenum cofactor guanylyltransferase MobA [Cognatishimia sp. SS12]|uniref:molybdenum cofactor guanylyltransferase MobA n=1 Tax=Cognatishimia sp. SS12 TaxID=2979465 RepID=UPI00232ED44E|nr:molybdenum cofactor guanylyltransferase MobA [Cognatishimia sp. SS12]MDC0739085.1 molybdenum cofactor guanylyltransferase MobA [Cognatishimia sp. SS12]
MICAGVILAGGQARRMGGGDKGRLPLGTGSLLQEVIARLSPQVDLLALNANGDPARFADLDLPVIADSVVDFPGPLAGVLAGLDWAAAQGADAIITAAADTPFFPRDLADTLRMAVADMPVPLAIACSRDNKGRLWRQPTFGLWPVALREDLRAALSDGLRKVVLWTDRHNARYVEFDGAEVPFFNVNTPQDLAEAQKRAAGSA